MGRATSAYQRSAHPEAGTRTSGLARLGKGLSARPPDPEPTPRALATGIRSVQRIALLKGGGKPTWRIISITSNATTSRSVPAAPWSK